jgi:hypothetical protein
LASVQKPIAALAFVFIFLTRVRAGHTPGEVVLDINYRPADKAPL